MLQKTDPVAKATSTMTYSNRSNCVRGARAILANANAKVGVDFEVRESENGRWSWTPGSATPVALAITVTPVPPAPKSDKEQARELLANINAAGMPLALARPKPTPEEMEALMRKTAKTTGRDREIKNPKSSGGKKAARSTARGGAKTTKAALIGEMLSRKEGCTTAEVLKATGWPSVSMPAQAKQVGVKLVKEKVKGQPTRYRAA